MNKYLEELKNSPLVREKDLGNGVRSYNFTRDAFFNAEWNETTERARGIFCDEDTERVVARSFDKFFAIFGAFLSLLFFFYDAPPDISISSNHGGIYRGIGCSSACFDNLLDVLDKVHGRSNGCILFFHIKSI